MWKYGGWRMHYQVKDSEVFLLGDLVNEQAFCLTSGLSNFSSITQTARSTVGQGIFHFQCCIPSCWAAMTHCSSLEFIWFKRNLSSTLGTVVGIENDGQLFFSYVAYKMFQWCLYCTYFPQSIWICLTLKKEDYFIGDHA